MQLRNTPEFKQRVSLAFKRLWKDPEFRQKIAAAQAKIDWHTINSKKWKNPEYRVKVIAGNKKHWENPAFREKMAKIYAEVWSRPERLLKASETGKKLWSNPAYRNKIFTAGPSSLQMILYSLLDDFKVKYYREYKDKQPDSECFIGPYTFDCVIPREGRPTLLIEVDGEYAHSSLKNQRRDRAKDAYIADNFPTQYELRRLLEVDFLNRDKVSTLIKQWLGLAAIEMVNFSLKDIIIRENPPASERKLLLGKYCHFSTAGRGGKWSGAYFNNELIGICVFSQADHGFKELSRFCVNPAYLSQGFGSWFIKEAIKLLPSISGVIAYGDETFSDAEAIYQNAGFTPDGVVAPDYWYVGEGEWVMHRETLCRQAASVHSSEGEYALTHGYKKTGGLERLRFVLKLGPIAGLRAE